MKKVRILIADDHDIVLVGIRLLIEAESGWEICGEATNGREAVTLAGQLEPDIVVLDVAMPELNGVDATRQIKQLLPETEVLAFTGTESEALLHQLFSAGARAYVLKNEAGEQLIPAIKALCRHQPYLVARNAQVILQSYLHGGIQTAQAAPNGLSPREREIVQALAEGKSNKEVAAGLGISVRTAETHRRRIMQKLGLRNISDLIRFALRHQLAQP